ncbi:unnamed protein product [Effrenium voratum]|nr:unnamed protein product [Effrenium voratum]
MDVEDGRHFRNVMDDRSAPADWKAVLQREIVAGKKAVLEATHEKGSVYTGLAGAAYMLLDMSSGTGTPEGLSLCRDALRLLEQAEEACDPQRATLLEGQAGCVALKAWAYRSLGQQTQEQECVRRLGHLAERAAALPLGDCEVLYGRCGFLGAVLLVWQRLQDPRLLAGQAAELVSQVIAAGKRDAKDGWPLCFEWHDKCYLGGAHGIAGILCTLLQLPAELSLAGVDSPDLVRRTADKLLDCRFRSGNVASSLGNGKDRLVQFCHGAAGLIPLALRLAALYGDRYMELAHQLGQVVWVRGLLKKGGGLRVSCQRSHRAGQSGFPFGFPRKRKNKKTNQTGKRRATQRSPLPGPGLCHGISGNGFALLSLCPTGEVWRHRALHFASFAIEHRDELLPLADRPYSLFEGLAGAVCFWSALLREGDVAGFPCYDFA